MTMGPGLVATIVKVGDKKALPMAKALLIMAHPKKLPTNRLKHHAHHNVGNNNRKPAETS